LSRLLYAVEQAERADATRLANIAAAGKILVTAMKFARCEPDTMGARAAPERAREGVDKLAAVGWPAGVAELVSVAKKRVG
jgi:hypothetical protein